MKVSPFLEISKRLHKLDEKQQQAFRNKLAKQGINSWQLPIVASEQARYPLSLAQQRFLVAEKMSDRAIYNLCSVIEFDLHLDHQVLTQAINQLINRHQVMTTCFKQDQQGQWYQQQLNNYQISLVPEIISFEQDQKPKQKQEQQSWLNQYFEQQQTYQFDLSKEAPFRVKLYRDQNHYWLFVTIHHVAFDAWSFDVFNQELAQLYHGIVNQQAVELPALSIQYQDYAYWQKQWLQSDDYLKQQDYWQQQLADLPEVLTLPVDYSHKSIRHRSYDGQVAHLLLDAELSQQLRQTINHQSSTLYVYLQTAFSWLLAKYSDQYDFCFGSSIANRKRAELSSLVGPLLNTLVIRHRLSTEQSFTKALKQCQTTTTEAFDNQDYPFEQLRALLQEGNQQGNNLNKLFRVMFIHVGLANNEKIALGNSQGKVVTPEQNNARFDLSLRVIEQLNQQISLELEYSTELFDQQIIRQLLNDFEHIITTALSNPNITLAALSLSNPLSTLSGPPLNNRLRTLNETIANHPSEQVALFDGQQSITYRQLNQHIAQLVSWLQQQILKMQQATKKRQTNKKQQTIALVMHRTPLQVSLMLASWRLGAVCLMLDPRQPLNRLNAICKDAQVGLVISDQNYGFSAAPEVTLTQWPAIKSEKLSVIEEQTSPVSLTDIAYILYTSGSTGKPKGIVISHQAVSHYATAISQQYPQPQHSRWLTLATVAADLGLTSILAALYQGQCLLLPPNEVIFDPNLLAEFLSAHPADCLKITPSHLNALLSIEQPQTILPKRCLFLGGEGLNQTLFDKLKSLSPALKIINHYGPSESTVGITSNLLKNNLQNTLSQVAPLGLPLPGNHISLRNKQGYIVPQGVIAELCISSPQLANGYWKDAAQSQQVFIEIKNENYNKYYKTGDLAKINKHGQVEFLGRADDQIKRRGYRLELDEISQWLCAQPEIDNAIVLMKTLPVKSTLVKAQPVKAVAQREQLIAWVQFSNQSSDNLSEMKIKISTTLPEYMLPDKWHEVDVIELNDNGKIDRKALPLPQVSNEIDDIQRPLTQKEQALSFIWKQLLGLDGVLATDDFFALGGDSIMSLQMIGLAKKQGLILTPNQIIQQTTLSKMAASAEEELSESAEKIVLLYQKVLSADSLTGHDDFFHSGGDSILSLQFIALAKQQGLTITPKQLIDNPNPILLAKKIDKLNHTNNDILTNNSSDKFPANKPDLIDITKPQPLSLAQQRIWFIQQLEPKSTAYNLPAIFNLKGTINQQKFLTACQQLVKKHLMLRVKYFERDVKNENQIFQQVINSYQPLTIHPMLTSGMAIAKAQRLAQQNFNLSTGKVIAIDLLPITTQQHILVFNIHHIATDGWSMGLLIQDLLQLYQTSKINQATPFIEQISNQLNYLDWSNSPNQQQVDVKQTDYWLQRLKGIPHQLDIAFDHALPSQQTYHGATQQWQLDQSIINILDHYAKQLQTTPFNLLLAGFQLLLWRYSGQQDFAIGIPVSGREEPITQNMVGVFTNTLINRAQISPTQSTSQWLTSHIKALQGDLNHQQMPVEHLLNLLNPVRNLTRPAVYQVIFNYQNDQQKQRVLNLPDVSFTPIEHDEISTKFELSFNLLRRDGVTLQIEYNTDLFEQETIEQLFNDYLAILAWLPKAQTAPLSSLQLPSMNKALSFASSQGTESPISDMDDFVYRFEQQVIKQPQAIAVIDNQQRYSYDELNNKANQLAHWLVEKGAKKDQLVAFCLPRNHKMLVALIAIQKAGAAYLPLDVKQPAARLAYIIEHAKPILCLTTTATEHQLPTTLQSANLDKLVMPLLTMPTTNLSISVSARQLAYTLYTSGSTGKPKGVEIERGSFAAFLRAIATITPEFERVLALTTVTFDIAGLELCLPLVLGASVVIADEENQRDNQQLVDLVVQHHIDLIQATPATWDMLSQLETTALNHTHAICGGEALSGQLAGQLMFLCKSVTNVYGPTEATVWSSAYRLTDHRSLSHIHSSHSSHSSHMASSHLASTHIPIGQPLPNNQFYVLDKQQALTPSGVPGELYIGGKILARGYRFAEELTEKVFIKHPEFGRLYRTGDRVKWLKSNQLSFIGRCDFQIKHRGYRIEPGEIEAALIQHPDIHQVVVSIKDHQLVAYIVTAAYKVKTNNSHNATPTQSTHREILAALNVYLSQLLPDYMIPQYFQQLESLPLNSNGKVDRQSLAALTKQLDQITATDDELLLTEQEEKLASIWRKLLNNKKVQPQDNFFFLGGHSLLATQLKAKLNAIGLNIPLKSLFETPTLAEQAKLLTTSKYQTIPLVGNLTPAPTMIPLSNAQKRLWFMQQLDLNNTRFNMQTVVRINGELDAKVLAQAIKAVSKRHPILQVVYHNIDGEPVQLFKPTIDVAFIQQKISADDISDSSNSNNNDIIAAQIDLAANYTFDLEQESPLRIYLYQETDKRHICQLVQHHIASDAWSMTLLLDHLMQTYQQIIAGKTVDNDKLNMKPDVSYLDYAYWQNTPAIVEQQTKSLGYWQQMLAGAPTKLTLPFDHARPGKNNHQGDIVNITLSKALHAQLKSLAQQQQCSLFMVLLSAYSTLIYQQTRSQDIIIGTDVANREHYQTQNMLGFFVNLLPLRLKPKATMRFSDFLQQVKQHCLNCFEHQSVPFEQIVETVKPERIAGMHPLIQTLFVMQNTPDNNDNHGGLTITPMEINQHHAKFDCAFFANQEKKSGELLFSWVFNSQLFNKKTIEDLTQLFVQLLEAITHQPRTPLNNLIAKKKNNQSTSTTANRPDKKNKLNKLSKINKLKKLKTAKSEESKVDVAPLTSDRPFPLLVQCKTKSLDPLTWARQNQKQIMSWLECHGGIVFRGFNLPTALEFEQFCLAIYPELYALYGDLPKNDVGSKIYKSTPYPNDQMIMFHNESSHQNRWPRHQWFYCSQPSDVGGATPIVDCREIYRRLPQDIRIKLEEKQLCYIRNFSNLDVSWQHFFKTDNRQQVEATCRENNIEYNWSGEDKLKISQLCPAIITHPITREKSFFNQIQLHHYSFLEDDIRQHLLETGGENNLPRNVFYGDLTPLEQDVIEVISELYEACAVRFDWQQADVVMLDNMLAAHARDPFEGERKIAVAMGDIYQPAQTPNEPPKQVLNLTPSTAHQSKPPTISKQEPA